MLVNPELFVRATELTSVRSAGGQAGFGPSLSPVRNIRIRRAPDPDHGENRSRGQASTTGACVPQDGARVQRALSD
jgi:hypothetical protein